jgi:hypothetical protein
VDVAILTFHFDLVHVPGTHHGPDGLSRRPRQVGDDEDRDDEEDFADWTDQLHGFLHQINVVDIRLLTTSKPLPLPFPHISTLTQATYLSEEETSTTDTDIDNYTLAPWSAQAKIDDPKRHTENTVCLRYIPFHFSVLFLCFISLFYLSVSL